MPNRRMRLRTLCRGESRSVSSSGPRTPECSPGPCRWDSCQELLRESLRPPLRQFRPELRHRAVCGPEVHRPRREKSAAVLRKITRPHQFAAIHFTVVRTERVVVRLPEVCAGPCDRSRDARRVAQTHHRDRRPSVDPGRAAEEIRQYGEPHAAVTCGFQHGIGPRSRNGDSHVRVIQPLRFTRRSGDRLGHLRGFPDLEQ